MSVSCRGMRPCHQVRRLCCFFAFCRLKSCELFVVFSALSQDGLEPCKRREIQMACGPRSTTVDLTSPLHSRHPRSPNTATGNPGAAALTPNSDVMLKFQRNGRLKEARRNVSSNTDSVIRDSKSHRSPVRTRPHEFTGGLLVELCGQRQQRRRRRHRRPWFRMIV